MATKAPTLWLVREPTKRGEWYLIYKGNKPRKAKGMWIGRKDDESAAFCVREWESFGPKAVHLRPGGGPIRIRVQRVPTTKVK